MSDASKRSKNFSPFERNLLVDLVLHRKEVIENKKTDGATVAEKKRAWEDLCKIFNASGQTGGRTAKQLKELYFLMKKNARKHNNEDRIGYLQTGGGTHDPNSDQIDLKIVAALKNQFEPDENPFDSSAVIYEDAVSIEDMNPEEASCSNNIVIETIAIDDDTLYMDPVIVGSENIEVIRKIDDLSTLSPQPAPKRKANYLRSVSESMVNRKKAKSDIDEGLASIKTRELQMKETQHNKKCEILDIQKRIALKDLEKQDKELAKQDKELEKQDYELKIKELDYKIKFKQFEML